TFDAEDEQSRLARRKRNWIPRVGFSDGEISHTDKERLMKVQGSCHCGQVTYEAEIDPERVSLCNCTDCQMLTGSAFRVSVPAPKEAFRMLTGKPKTYVKTAESGAKRTHAFCLKCGTPIYACANVD